ncbi:MAG: hypothetical protein KDI36_17815, partial [Pseudomonadales bacterium]|nr:hypothetical protein [Pseudomonadales bacterium]
MEDSEAYRAKKAFFSRLITIYGRKPVLEALEDADLNPWRLHLADSNRPTGIIADILALAERRGTEVRYHSRQALARISRNGKQDQGVALDISAPGYQSLDDLLALAAADEPLELIALDSITNPQNLGMIIRSVAASPATGLLLPRLGTAGIDPLVIKASAGTVFKARIFHCETLLPALQELRARGCEIIGLSGEASRLISQVPMTGRK